MTSLTNHAPYSFTATYLNASGEMVAVSGTVYGTGDGEEMTRLIVGKIGPDYFGKLSTQWTPVLS